MSDEQKVCSIYPIYHHGCVTCGKIENQGLRLKRLEKAHARLLSAGARSSLSSQAWNSPRDPYRQRIFFLTWIGLTIFEALLITMLVS
ncbi:transmembrane protein, putative [Medicago truncatula]|uniref:Transmembrane protein, putative n=1 Tax=Medicago truncatula TaxID=3880 RepID=A0A072V292_MEDTR|nr:transmembrane protein, putative [Medicago truncatula]